jgi:hypothetical protein
MTVPGCLFGLIGRLRATASRIVCLLSALAVCGCSIKEGVGPYLVDPARYDVYHCKEFAPRLKELTDKEELQRDLINKANQGGGGTVIGGLSYRVEYERTIAEEKLLRRTAAEKKCELPADNSPAPAAASSPAPTGASNQPSLAAPTAYQSDQSIH